MKNYDIIKILDHIVQNNNSIKNKKYEIIKSIPLRTLSELDQFKIDNEYCESINEKIRKNLFNEKYSKLEIVKTLASIEKLLNVNFCIVLDDKGSFSLCAKEHNWINKIILLKKTITNK